MPIQVGDLRCKISIETGVATVGDYNETTYTWGHFKYAFAKIDTRRSAEVFDVDSKQRYSKTVYLFTVRAGDIVGVSSQSRINYRSQIYEIKDIRPDKTRWEYSVIEADLIDGVITR